VLSSLEVFKDRLSFVFAGGVGFLEDLTGELVVTVEVVVVVAVASFTSDKGIIFRILRGTEPSL